MTEIIQKQLLVVRKRKYLDLGNGVMDMLMSSLQMLVENYYGMKEKLGKMRKKKYNRM